MKYFVLTIIFILTSCSLNKNSAYWNHDRKTSKISNIDWTDNLSLEEFKSKLDSFANNAPYPKIDN
tara:strand:+ start:1139 stop:1336 length:198 start_codon:yes stop_codon:yes gene_type:complete